MDERPQVYKANNVQRLEHFRKRYAEASKREHVRLAMEHAEVIHETLVEILDRLDKLSVVVEALSKRIT